MVAGYVRQANLTLVEGDVTIEEIRFWFAWTSYLMTNRNAEFAARQDREVDEITNGLYEQLRPLGGSPGEEEGGSPGQEEGGSPGEQEGGSPGEEESGSPGDEEGGPPGEEEGGSPGEEAGGSPGAEEGGSPSEEETKQSLRGLVTRVAKLGHEMAGVWIPIIKDQNIKVGIEMDSQAPMQNIDDDIKVGSTKVTIVLCGAWMKDGPVRPCVYTKARVSCIV